MVGVAYGVVLEGIVATVVRVEADVSQGLPQFSIVGLPDSAVSESRLRIRAAIRNSGLSFPNSRITINLSPASLRKRGAGLDLAIAVAILSATGLVPPGPLEDTAFSAELSLSGGLVSVPGVMNLALELKNKGIRQLVISSEQISRCLSIPDFTWVGLESLDDVTNWLRGLLPLSGKPLQPEGSCTSSPDIDEDLDMSDVEGLDNAKRALMIAACGGHHTLLVGPPGCGKTMLAERFASILPPLSDAQALEIYALHQACGIPRALTTRPPLRTPHHSLTVAGLIGGGSPPMPGEATFAHRGILVLDELLEFSRQTLDSLREPLTTGQIRLTRNAHTSVFPASFLLLGTLNPCLCGQLGTGTCTCLPSEVRRYWSRVSGPFYDRMELVITVAKRELGRAGTVEANVSQRSSSHDMRQVVTAGRAGLAERVRRLNDNVSDAGSDVLRLLQNSAAQLGLSRRASQSVLKVARTISALEGKDAITTSHLAEALAMRPLRPGDAKA